MGRKGYQALVLLLLFLLQAACKKDKPVVVTPPPSADSTDKVYVVCEGSLGNGNATLGRYDVKTGAVYDDLYKQANGSDLGDVFQSMTLIGDQYFLCVNNSDKIVVLNKADLKQTGTIKVPKPRYIVSAGAGKAYVSSLFSNKVHIINTNTLQVTGSIDMPAQNPEGMLLYNGKLYVCGWDTASDKVFVVNTATDQVEKEIAIASRAPQEVLADKDGNLWVLSGNVSKGKSAALTQIDASTGQTIRAYHFPEKADAIRPVFNNTKDVLYFIEVNYNGGTDYNGIYRMAINADKLPEQPLIQAEKFQYFWALGVQPDGNKLFIGDPKGFIQKGVVYIYDMDGNKQGQFETGVGPGHFYFDQN